MTRTAIACWCWTWRGPWRFRKRAEKARNELKRIESFRSEDALQRSSKKGLRPQASTGTSILPGGPACQTSSPPCRIMCLALSPRRGDTSKSPCRPVKTCGKPRSSYSSLMQLKLAAIVDPKTGNHGGWAPRALSALWASETQGESQRKMLHPVRNSRYARAKRLSDTSHHGLDLHARMHLLGDYLINRPF